MKNFVLIEYDPNIGGGGVHDSGRPLAVSDCKQHLKNYCVNIINKTLLDNSDDINGWKPFCVIEETNLVIV